MFYSREEAQAELTKAGCDPAQAEAIARAIDESRNGYVTTDELRTAIREELDRQRNDPTKFRGKKGDDIDDFGSSLGSEIGKAIAVFVIGLVGIMVLAFFAFANVLKPPEAECSPLSNTWHGAPQTMTAPTIEQHAPPSPTRRPMPHSHEEAPTELVESGHDRAQAETMIQAVDESRANHVTTDDPQPALKKLDVLGDQVGGLDARLSKFETRFAEFCGGTNTQAEGLEGQTEGPSRKKLKAIIVTLTATISALLLLIFILT